MNKYKLNLYLPLLGAVIVMFIITIMGFMYLQKADFNEDQQYTVSKFFSDLEIKSQYDTKVFSRFIDIVESDKTIIKSFESRDKKELFNITKPLYEKLNKDIDLTHFYFILNDGTVFLRVHNYERDGDIIKRTTFLNAQKQDSLASGLEFGLMKNYTLRVVKPWVVNGKKIGYIELGKEIDKTILYMSKFLDTQIYLAVKKDQFADVPDKVTSMLKNKIATNDYYILYNTDTVPKEINSILDKKSKNRVIDLNHKKYFVSFAPMKDVSQKQLGYILFLGDVTAEYSTMYDSVKILMLFLALFTLLFLFIVFKLIQRSETKIFKLTLQLNKKNQKLQKLFDVQRNITVISDGQKTTLVNKAGLNFFNADSLDELKKFCNDISEKFIPSNGYFSLEKVQQDKNWIETIEPMSGDKRVVTMLDAENTPHAFNISISQFENEQHLVVFTDISATMIEKIDLTKKIEKDELTDTFNRKFLNNHITSIIKSLPSSTYLGVALLDIDYFKRVNDTYGHNVGDIILKEFSQYIKSSIRSDDFLIRWGGEEFIVLTKSRSDEALLRAAEHIRQRIEHSNFDTVGSITCSIGTTLYIPGEDIKNTINRADEALYQSKSAGRNRVTQFKNVDDDKIIVPVEERYLKAVLDENGIIVEFECNIMEKDNYIPEEVIGKNWFDLFLHTNDMQKTTEYFKSLISGEDITSNKHTNDIICKDGTHKFLDFTNTVFTKDGKKFISFMAQEHL